MPATARVYVTGLVETQADIDRVLDRLGRPNDGLVKATNRVAEVWGRNFDSEGSAVGGWAALSEQTVARREAQGFPGDHPIMIRYGALRAVAIDLFQNARGSTSTTRGDSYSRDIVHGSLNIDRDTAHLFIGDSYKVMNHWGFPDINGSGDHPARPFWFVNREAVAAAADGIKQWLGDEVLR